MESGAGISRSYRHLETSPGRHQAAIALEFGIIILLRDAENAISDGIQKQLQLQANQYGGTTQGNNRLNNLNEWLAVDEIINKFSHYCPKYNQLASAITNTRLTAGRGPALPGITRTPLSPSTIAHSLFARAKKPLTESGRPPLMVGAPLFQGGAFNRILQPLIRLVTDQMSIRNPSESEQKAFVGDTAMNVFNKLGISLLPWSSEESGSNSGWSTWNSWILVTTSSQPRRPKSVPKLIILTDDEIEIESDISMNPSPRKDSQRNVFTGSWTPSSLSILEMPAHLNIQLRPDKLQFISKEVAACKEVVQQNYQWAHLAYNTQHPIHRLAFFTAWVMNSMAPQYLVFTKSAPVDQPPEWTDKISASRRRLESGPSCFGWWLMYLLTMLDPRSPLRSRLGSVTPGYRVVLGADWVDTMSMLYSFKPSILILILSSIIVNYHQPINQINLQSIIYSSKRDAGCWTSQGGPPQMEVP